MPQIRELLADALGQCGARVTAADSGVEGLALLERERPDALDTLRAGFEVHIAKPVDLRKLAEVGALLSRQQSETGARA